MVSILREADKGPVADIAKKHGISEQTFYTWRKRFGAIYAFEVKRLKKILDERDLEIEVMKVITKISY